MNKQIDELVERSKVYKDLCYLYLETGCFRSAKAAAEERLRLLQMARAIQISGGKTIAN